MSEKSRGSTITHRLIIRHSSRQHLTLQEEDRCHADGGDGLQQSADGTRPTDLHGFIADKLEAATGKTVHQTEVRFKDLSVPPRL